MKLEISLHLFSSPTSAFGRVSGEMEFDGLPVVGQEIALEDVFPRREIGNKGLIISVARIKSSQDSASPRIIMEDYIANDRYEAAIVGKYFEDKLGFYYVIFEEIYDGNQFI